MTDGKIFGILLESLWFFLDRMNSLWCLAGNKQLTTASQNIASGTLNPEISLKNKSYSKVQKVESALFGSAFLQTLDFSLTVLQDTSSCADARKLLHAGFYFALDMLPRVAQFLASLSSESTACPGSRITGHTIPTLSACQARKQHCFMFAVYVSKCACINLLLQYPWKSRQYESLVGSVHAHPNFDSDTTTRTKWCKKVATRTESRSVVGLVSECASAYVAGLAQTLSVSLFRANSLSASFGQLRTSKQETIKKIVLNNDMEHRRAVLWRPRTKGVDSPTDAGH